MGSKILADSSDWCWHALYVRSRAEKVVHAQLLAKQCDAFLPLYRTRKRWADRYKTLELPLFPGYVFCRFSAVEKPLVLATSGVVCLIQAGNRPAPIDAGEVEAIRRAVSSPMSLERYAGLVKGQKVTMVGGPLFGLSGQLMEVRNSLRLVLSVELLQRSVLVEIEREWIDVPPVLKPAVQAQIPSKPEWIHSFGRKQFPWESELPTSGE